MKSPTTQKHIIPLLTLLAAALLLPIRSYGNSDYSFRHIDGSNGLSTSNVKCVLRDDCGFMWFGTKNGLNRYDGYDIRQFNCFDHEQNKGNNNIGALYEDTDKNLWVGTDRGIYIYNPHTDSFRYVNRRDSDGSEAVNWVQTIDGDKNGNVWAVLPDMGIFRYFDDKVRFYNLPGTERFKEVYFSNLCVDGDGATWALTSGAGIYRYDPNTDSFIEVKTAGPEESRDIPFSNIIDAGDGTLILAASDGRLFRLSPSQANRFTAIPFSQGGKIYLRSIGMFDGSVWVGAQTGLFIIDPVTGEETKLTENPVDRFSLSDNTVYFIYRDCNNDIWLGTMFGGVNYLSRRPFRFRSYGIDANLSSRKTIGMACDHSGKIWVGTEDAGLNVFNPVTGTAVKPVSVSPEKKMTLTVNTFNGSIFAGFSRGGLYRILPDGRSIPVFDQPDHPDNSVYSYMVDSQGNEWMGFGFALYRRDAGEEEFRHISATGYDWIFCIFEADDGTIWLGTMGNGVWKYNPRNGKFKSYTYNDGPNPPNGLRSNSISSIMEDSGGNIWLSTDRGGLSRYNKETDDFTTFGVAEGLPDNVVYSVLEDKHRNLWFGTNKGLVKFNPQSGKIKVFTVADGLPFNQFSYNSAVKHPSGDFYFGGINGMVAFNPDLEGPTDHPIPIYFTNLNILNEDVKSGEDGSPLKDNIVFTRSIKLRHDQSTFTLSVAAPDYGHVGQQDFRYRLLPINEEWIKMNGNQISFTNLAPGKYRLEVQAENDGPPSIRELKITITPPWWKSPVAFTIYGVLTVLCAIIWFRWYRNRNERDLHDREEAFAINKEKELYRAKVNFFTEIAHEIRTPLSLIDIPLEAVEEIGLDHPDAKRYLKVMRQNTSRLLQLTSQLLDFQKIDSNKLTLKRENINIPELVNETIERFEPAITLSGKEIVREITQTPLTAAVDREALTKILSNLLNNALKYAGKTIRVTLTHDDSSFTVKVISDGATIAPGERSRIFEPFYQTNNAREEKNGVGIGLPLSRSLATLLNGTLVLEDTSDGLNTFVLTLPVNGAMAEDPQAMDTEKGNYLLEDESNLTKSRSDGYDILIVEDNEDIRTMLTEQLGHFFFTDSAPNGAVAMEKLRDRQFDIVVTDIMMPVMDGMELCRQIKADQELSHMPVVFITAKNDLESKIKGLRLGAEAYIEKPFSLKYLRQMLLSLLDNRRRERESFSKKPFFKADNMKMNKADEEFMNKVIDTIHAHISEEDFNVEAMTDKLCMSRSNLLRKIKTIFNLSPSELIRLVKLKKAAELIKEGKYRIGEIGLMVGISSPSYFSKLFFKQFNVTPKDFAKQCQQQGDRHVDLTAGSLPGKDPEQP